MKSFEIPASDCPTCGKAMDAATNVEGQGSPSAGDLTVCVYCGALLRFGEDLRLSLAPAGAELQLPKSTRRWMAVLRMQPHVRALRREMN